MSLHVFGAILTAPGVAANNRGENEGNITTLQKLLWHGRVHTTVSAEAIRWALRYYWQCAGIPVNRRWDDDKEDHTWEDDSWQGWKKASGETFIDDDLLGFMKAEGGKTEGEKGQADKRRGVMELSRAVSTTPFIGDITFNAKSGEKGRTSLYGTEVHATRYQYGFALTPERLRVEDRALAALDAICNLGEVAGNHSRFLFDFSPDALVLRITQDPAPRLLYCFEEAEDGRINVDGLVEKLRSGDIAPGELYVGGSISACPSLNEVEGIHLFPGVKAATEACKSALGNALNISGAKAS